MRTISFVVHEMNDYQLSSSHVAHFLETNLYPVKENTAFFP